MQRLPYLAALVVSLIAVSAHCINSNSNKREGCPVVESAFGKIQGYRVNTSVSSFCSFIGIHYGKDTSGVQRFKPPQPADPWQGVLNATTEGPLCPQYPFSDEMNEDCLLLNIHSPIGFQKGALRPVLFWLHGGEFRFGNGNPETYDPRYFLKNDVVIVTIQYRLGSFGFLNVNHREASGNMGLKDQVLALRWVQETIHTFGGNPDAVTIFGQSAGGIAITALMLSPMAQGLFQRGIVMSGSILGYRFFNTQPEPFAYKLGVQLGYNKTDPEDLVNHLRSFPAEDVVAATMSMEFADDFQRGYNNYIPFVASIDKEFDGIEAFLPLHPIYLVNGGDFERLPLMVGFTNREGIKVFEQLGGHFEYLDEINIKFTETVVPNDIPGDREQAAQNLRKFYFGDKPLNNDTFLNYITMATDSWYVHPTDYFLRLLEVVGNNQPVYYYEFSFDGAFNFFKTTVNAKYPGASHADDLGYLWHSDLLADKVDASGASEKVRERHVQMFVNFAVEGDPTPTKSDLIPVKWTPIEYPNMRYMEIDEDLEMVNHSPRRNVTIFWQNIYDLERI